MNPETSPRSSEPDTGEDQDLRKALDEEKLKAEGYLNNWKRAQADFINYRKHCEQEKQEIGQAAAGCVMLNVLPALDDLERAIGAIPPELERSGWVEGFKLIRHKLKACLEAQGLKLIEAEGKPFDPRFHEAVKHDKGPEGIVLAEIQKGYMLYDKLLRPACVIVGSGEGSHEKED